MVARIDNGYQPGHWRQKSAPGWASTGVCGPNQTAINVVREARAIPHGVDLGREPVHTVMQRRRDMPQGVLHVQQLAIGVVSVAGPEAQRVDIRSQPALAVVELGRAEAQRVFHRDQPGHRIVDVRHPLL